MAHVIFQNPPGITTIYTSSQPKEASPMPMPTDKQPNEGQWEVSELKVFPADLTGSTSAVYWTGKMLPSDSEIEAMIQADNLSEIATTTPHQLTASQEAVSEPYAPNPLLMVAILDKDGAILSWQRLPEDEVSNLMAALDTIEVYLDKNAGAEYYTPDSSIGMPNDEMCLLINLRNARTACKLKVVTE